MTDKMQDITPFAGLLPIVELWNQLQLPLGQRGLSNTTAALPCGGSGRAFRSEANLRVSCPVCREFRKSVETVQEKDWRPLGNGQEWAEVVYAPQSLSLSKKGPTYRSLAVREVFDLEESGKKRQLSQELQDSRQLLIPELIEDLESENAKVKKLHLTEMEGRVYKVFGIVTNCGFG